MPYLCRQQVLCELRECLCKERQAVRLLVTVGPGQYPACEGSILGMPEDWVAPDRASRVPVNQEGRVLEDDLTEVGKEGNCAGTGKIFRLPGTVSLLVQLRPDYREKCWR